MLGTCANRAIRPPNHGLDQRRSKNDRDYRRKFDGELEFGLGRISIGGNEAVHVRDLTLMAAKLCRPRLLPNQH